MSDQLALVLDPSPPRAAVGLVRHESPPTSVAAAARVRPDSPLMRDIERVLVAHPRGLCDHEIAAELDLPAHLRGSAIRRRADLGCVDTGDRRPTPTGRASIVWRLPS